MPSRSTGVVMMAIPHRATTIPPQPGLQEAATCGMSGRAGSGAGAPPPAADESAAEHVPARLRSSAGELTDASQKHLQEITEAPTGDGYAPWFKIRRPRPRSTARPRRVQAPGPTR